MRALLLWAAVTASAAVAQPIVITDVSVVDVEAGAVVPGQTVVVDGDRIVAVGPSASVPVPDDAAVVDGAGRFLIPGLWDMHVHSSSDRITRETMLPLYIANGVTGVRDMKGDCFAPCDEISSSVEQVDGWRRDIARGDLVGPRIVAGSDLLNGPAPGDSSSVERPATEAEGRALARLLVARGVDFAKPYSMLPRDAYFGLAEEAAALGLPLAGHVPLEVWPSEAIAAGQRSIEHQLGLVEECSTRREELVPQLLANIQSGAEDMLAPLSGMVESHSPEACAALFEQMVEAGTWSVPTLVVQRWVVLDPVDPRLRYLAPEERTYWDETLARQAEIWPEDPRFEALHHELTVAMHRAGVRILAGSDAGAPGAFAGFGLHDELAWLVRIGMTPAEALRAATLGPAEYLEATDSLGTVAPGRAADLVLLDANPLDDIAHTQRIRAVVARGRLFDRAALDGLLEGVARAASPSSLVLHNGRVWTGDPAQPWAEAVAVDGERIAAVGTDADVLALAGPDTRTLDLGGRLVIPGLNDAHSHFGADDGAHRLTLGEGPTPNPSWDEVLAAVAEAVPAAADGQWISGEVGPVVLDDPRTGRADLDRLAPEHPVVLEGFTGHGYVLNTAALTRLGLTDADLDRPGGWVVRRDGEDAHTGILHEYAKIEAGRRRQQALPPEAHAEAYREVAAQLARWGITSVQHHASALTLAETVAALDAARVPIRWSVLRWPVPDADVFEAWSEDRATPTAPRTRVFGIKWMLDGTPVERLGAFRTPYADRPGHHGRTNFTPAEVRRMLGMALMTDEQVAFHIAGDSTLAVVLRAMADLAPPEAWRARRVRLEHGDGLAPDQVAAVREFGIVLIQNPLHFGNPADVLPRMGAERAAHVQPLRSAVEAGIPLALGVDAGGAGRNPFVSLMLATVHPSNPAEALTAEQALAAYTRGSAYAEGMEHEKGALRAGMLADLAVLSQDLFSVPPTAWPATESLLTLVGGEVVHRSDALPIED